LPEEFHFTYDEKKSGNSTKSKNSYKAWSNDNLTNDEQSTPKDKKD